MAYRDDVAALEARLAALSADLVVRVRERDEAARLLDEARARAHAAAYLADLETGGPARRRRKRVRIAAMATGLAMMIGGLVAYRARPHEDRFEQAMQKFEKFADDMCACKDKECATQVSDEMSRWGTAMTKQWQPEPKPSDDQMKRATVIATRMGECMQKAFSVGDPSQLE